MKTITLSAHFDGERIQLDDPFDLEPDAKLLVTVLPDDAAERRDWETMSMNGLAGAYSDDEPEYPLHLIKEPNPNYEGR